MIPSCCGCPGELLHGICIFLIPGKRIKKALFKPIERKEIDQLIRTVRAGVEMNEQGITREKLTSFDLSSGNRLANILLGDILEVLPEKAPLMIVPDDSLGALPFEILPLSKSGAIRTGTRRPYVVGAEFFGDRNPISYCQSITAPTLAGICGNKDAPA